MAEGIARLGMINSLAQTVLKLTVPGVPDIYQGCELWDFSPRRSRQPPAGGLRASEGNARLAGGSGPARSAGNVAGRPGEDVRRAGVAATPAGARGIVRGRRLPGSDGHGQIRGERGGVRAWSTEDAPSLLVVVPRLTSQRGQPALGRGVGQHGARAGPGKRPPRRGGICSPGAPVKPGPRGSGAGVGGAGGFPVRGAGAGMTERRRWSADFRGCEGKGNCRPGFFFPC